jgi:hypothetical protein
MDESSEDVDCVLLFERVVTKEWGCADVIIAIETSFYRIATVQRF